MGILRSENLTCGFVDGRGISYQCTAVWSVRLFRTSDDLFPLSRRVVGVLDRETNVDGKEEYNSRRGDQEGVDGMDLVVGILSVCYDRES